MICYRFRDEDGKRSCLTLPQFVKLNLCISVELGAFFINMQSRFIKYRLFLLAGLLLLTLSWASYSGNASHELLSWDDAPYVTNNIWVTNPSLEGIRSLFTESKVANWHPLTWLSYIPEYYFCETNASCYKNTNIFLHGMNSFLVFLLSGLVFYTLSPEGGRGSFRLGELTRRDIFAASLMS